MDGGPRLEGDNDADGRVLDPSARIAHQQGHAVSQEMRTERDAGFGLLRTEEARSGFDDGHLRSEPRERLPELDADGAAAEDGERAGELTRQRRLAVGPEFHRVEPRDGRN